MKSKPVPYDVAVIGAGINGAGIARDAALRGLSVVVVDQADLCSGTSAIASRLIHGGLRYLEYGEIPLVFESLRERITLRRLAPHLVKPLRICIPVFASAKRGPMLVRLGMLAYDLLSAGKTVPNHEMLSREEIIEAEPGLLRDGLRAAARYYDAQIAFVERLVLENLLAARSAGARIATYCKLTGFEVARGDQPAVIRTEDTLDGRTREIEARVVVNAAGPWADQVLSMGAPQLRRLIGGTKGSHIVVGDFDGAPQDAFYVEAAHDQRPFFIIPWFGQYLIGTTDTRYDGDLRSVRASDEEIDYLLRETNRVFPKARLGRGDIHYAYAGVRPLPYRSKGPESAITRRHIIKVHGKKAPGLVSIVGGKLTTYRNLSRQAVDGIGRQLARKLPECRTADVRLPGAYRLDEARAALQACEALSRSGVQRMLSVYGGLALDVLALAASEPPLGATLDADRTVLAAEVVFAIRHEMARTLEDIVHRRLMIGLAADQGRPLYEMIAAIAASEFGWDDGVRHSHLRTLAAYSDSLTVSGE
jgi:glycerol-3-phosphate dehydrogenase